MGPAAVPPPPIHPRVVGGPPCSHPSRPPACSAPPAARSASRSTSAPGSPGTASSACPTRCAASRGTGCGPPCSARGAAVAEAVASPSTSPRPARASPGPGSTWPSPSACSSPASSCDRPMWTGHGFIGELGLDGSLRRVPGVAPMVAVLGDVVAVVPSAVERRGARRRRRCGVRVASTLGEVVAALTGEAPGPTIPARDAASTSHRRPIWPTCVASPSPAERWRSPPPADTTSSSSAHRGRARRCSPSDCRACSRRSTEPSRSPPRWSTRRPGCRCPAAGSSPCRRSGRRTTPRSTVALVGGGSATLRPGEISLASGGVLFLDELGEFAPAALDGLREPLEEGVIRVSRAHSHAVLPARFLLVAATNPCPCGGGPPGWCECDDIARLRYVRRLSGPLLDRFDLRVAVQRPGVDELLDPGGGEPSAVVAARVAAARRVALERSGRLNAEPPRRRARRVRPAHGDRPGPAAGGDRARPADRARLPPHPPRRPHDRRPRGRGDRPDADAAGAVDVEHVEVALSLRTRLRARDAGAGGVMADRPSATSPPSPAST